jgi:hypothetical protein
MPMARTNLAVSVGAWTADLIGGKHPVVTPADFTVVVDTNVLEDGRPKLVSSLVLLSQTWSYDGLEFGFGQPELVGTLPGYRRRGLVRVQMDAVHELSRYGANWPRASPASPGTIASSAMR